MKREHIFLAFILFFALVLLYLFYRILSPFLEPIFWAIIIATVCYPFYRKLNRFMKQKRGLSAMIMTFGVTLVLLLPFTLFVVTLANEVVAGYHSVEEMIKTGRLQAYFDQLRAVPILDRIFNKLASPIDLSQIDVQTILLKNIQQVSTFFFNQSSAILKGLSSFVIGFLFALLSLYYLFKDGHRLFETLKEALPVRPRERDLIFDRLQEMIMATIYGGVLIALIQGFLGGLSFWVLGIPSPVLWGTAMALLSFIPFGGTAFIWVPAAILLFLQGEFLKGAVLLAIGVFIISMVDNLLRPLFVGSRTHIHPLLLLFAALGGIQAFGLIGLVAGPLISVVCVTLIEIYTKGIK
ncbi:MAG: AI-2E family transporter [Syntrophaceae bacterium]|nr:AI-2E family transporter [Syntrophaceae bacterium]